MVRSSIFFRRADQSAAISYGSTSSLPRDRTRAVRLAYDVSDFTGSR